MNPTVWVVIETDKRNNRAYLYGVFATREAAEKDYGTPSDPYGVEITECKVIGR